MTNNRIRTLKLIGINPHCYWCGVKTLIMENPPLILPNNYATVDHLYSRRHKRIRKERELIGKKRNDGSNIYYVLACNRCNQRRSHEEQIEVIKKI